MYLENVVLIYVLLIWYWMLIIVVMKYFCLIVATFQIISQVDMYYTLDLKMDEFCGT